MVNVGDKIFIYCMVIIFGTLFLVTVIPILMQMAFGQTNQTVPPTAPTITNVPTPTTPFPNWQFLPQKAYVQPFGPEVGIPPNGLSLTAVPQVVPATPVATNGSGDFNMNTVIALAGTAGTALLAKFGLDKSKKNEVVNKELSAQSVDTKIVQQEIAKYMFSLDQAKANALNDAPAIKLDNLDDDRKKAQDTAAKA